MDCIVHGVTQNRTCLSNFYFTFYVSKNESFRKYYLPVLCRVQLFLFYFNKRNASHKALDQFNELLIMDIDLSLGKHWFRLIRSKKFNLRHLFY